MIWVPLFFETPVCEQQFQSDKSTPWKFVDRFGLLGISPYHPTSFKQSSDAALVLLLPSSSTPVKKGAHQTCVEPCQHCSPTNVWPSRSCCSDV